MRWIALLALSGCSLVASNRPGTNGCISHAPPIVDTVLAATAAALTAAAFQNRDEGDGPSTFISNVVGSAGVVVTISFGMSALYGYAPSGTACRRSRP